MSPARLGFLAVIIGSSIATAVYWAVGGGNGWVGYAVTVSIWFLATLGLQLSVKQARKPKMWGVPLLPWLPSSCIAANVFIMGSIDNPHLSDLFCGHLYCSYTTCLSRFMLRMMQLERPRDQQMHLMLQTLRQA
ncbi:hypothetical protein Ddye_019968 [Dipteronia dyeriana]|uniref:Cationic amino acid transporter C-terminal domain-containing protein n=1 Tax=Dipteronia dyeriana TaxID=168575 RepID=A0AAD9TZC0_9ROSI|nr:hypothetical protein Ddye_019968 [Dipteronia dyeriana]